MAYELTGTLTSIGDIQTFDSGFSKREFCVETAGDYPQLIKFELLKDKTSLLNDKETGDTLQVKFDIRGREYNGKVYNNLTAFAVYSQSSSAQADTTSAQQPHKVDPDDNFDNGVVDEPQTNMPF